ncbi:helix-turn-helix domain-containing protein [Cellulomonas palmilytica]|uniref:helix-turn-helix domain-containing protein n=1 Tax=Cellulomonas palmilytica TaxID=2608402 RepID=UPI001F2E456E|nr:helix-turn-helix domain-containing protein [Cellulomonas palmilytica]UJP39356.1 helix-turn-helix domain-containing protein [Cellulomonas palmilytica]
MTYDLAYQKRWRLDREQGRLRTVPATRARRHIERLRAAGCSVRGIAECAGLSPSVVSKIGAGKQPTVTVKVARTLLAVRPDSILNRPHGPGFVPNLGARRRIEALLALGWAHAHITERMGTRTTSQLVLHQVGDWIARETHDAVVAAYDALAMSPGPSERTRRRAAVLGYAPPLAWDDDTLDDPDARPQTGIDTDNVDPVAVARALDGDMSVPLNRDERAEVIAALAAGGRSDRWIAVQLGVVPETVRRERQRLGVESRWSA